MRGVCGRFYDFSQIFLTLVQNVISYQRLHSFLCGVWVRIHHRYNQEFSLKQSEHKANSRLLVHLLSQNAFFVLNETAIDDSPNNDCSGFTTLVDTAYQVIADSPQN